MMHGLTALLGAKAEIEKARLGATRARVDFRKSPEDDIAGSLRHGTMCNISA